ncbi:E3 ubiquitin ligase PARAQUAT TOLERANCE 3 isoform X1 [Coffea arabica]|uniref:E3 ubiquitin ligase PARAQUAT TOLERANCE 3 isoform X1 n=1 Tax=Coffea arabica TaxID=13443 RepID=A0A6P6TM61_COFAR|nr:E3 ubiquitin ligase PARAQUAT TOLERANCE 3-like isoform X1 [Coffea arabica]
MAVYYKFKSAKDFDSIPIDGHFITVGNLKEKIFEYKQLGRGTDFDLVVTNAQTNEEYLDETMLIPKNTAVLIRRVPGRPRMPIVTAPVPESEEVKVESESGEVQTVKSSFLGVESSGMKYPDESEWDEFGNDLYAIPETLPAQPSNLVQEAAPPSIVDEDSKIKALIETPALDWQRQSADGFGPGRGFGRGMGGRMMGGRGFGRGGLERKTPPQGYVCHRCKVPGHFIQHCPTNGDPNYDIKRVKPPTGIPKSMLMATPDGSYALPSGAVAVLKPNEAAFEKEIEGLPSTRSVGDLPPELHCPLCKEVMKDAVLTSKCCFKSFCDKCIREYIISKSMCVCGATNILADDLLPNKTLRDTINRILESNNSSGDNGGSTFQVPDMESRNPQPKAPSPMQSAASKGEQVMPPPAQKEETSKVHEVVEEVKAVVAPQQTMEKVRLSKVADASEATHESVSVKEPASQGSAPLPDEEVQQKPVSSEAAKKKKKKKARLPLNGVAAAEMQWRAQDLAAENYMMPMGPAAYNPYWAGMQPGMDAFMAPYPGAAPYMGFGLGPLDVPFGGVLPQDPFGGQGCMLPFGPPQRDLADFGMGFNAGPPLMSREEFEARKANLKRKREIERRGESRELPPKDREFGREVSSSGDISSGKSKSKAVPPPSSSDNHRPRHRSDRPSPDRRSRDPELPRPSSKKNLDHDYDDHHRHRDHRSEHYQDSHQHHRDHSDDRHHLDSRHPRDHPDDRHRRDQPQRSSSSHHRSESAARPTPEPLAAPKTVSTADKKQKISVFSRISFPAEDQAAPKKRKLTSSTEAPASGSGSHRGPSSNGYYEDHKAGSTTRKSSAPAAVDHESSDDDRHFKRRPSRYESSPPVAATREWEEEPRHSKREREKERGSYSKHR